MKKLVFIWLLSITSEQCRAQDIPKKVVSKNRMEVRWYFEKDIVHFEMTAPTKGWVAIGFNTHSGTQGTYLLMGNVIKGQAQVVEYYTLAPGNYKTVESLSGVPQLKNISGIEINNSTMLQFSLPKDFTSTYQRKLSENIEYTMLMAYSQQDDFQHHSIMRTSINVKL
ncbi:DOMON domain-containing protein [Maribacter sp. 4G9]|uniref:DOMON domain-containing protein n=1 Tax=Maribacter sp. 4G9 TaxID=1889777 RepID=UPI0013FD253F|nr:DOMON domain-containing protein [Maribacter sp. 4G9]